MLYLADWKIKGFSVASHLLFSAFFIMGPSSLETQSLFTYKVTWGTEFGISNHFLSMNSSLSICRAAPFGPIIIYCEIVGIFNPFVSANRLFQNLDLCFHHCGRKMYFDRVCMILYAYGTVCI